MRSIELERVCGNETFATVPTLRVPRKSAQENGSTICWWEPENHIVTFVTSKNSQYVSAPTLFVLSSRNYSLLARSSLTWTLDLIVRRTTGHIALSVRWVDVRITANQVARCSDSFGARRGLSASKHQADRHHHQN